MKDPKLVDKMLMAIDTADAKKVNEMTIESIFFMPISSHAINRPSGWMFLRRLGQQCPDLHKHVLRRTNAYSCSFALPSTAAKWPRT